VAFWWESGDVFLSVIWREKERGAKGAGVMGGLFSTDRERAVGDHEN
jgi:hypothetical protein